jgi:hypothetical protein
MLLAMIIGIVLLIISPSSQSRLASLSPGGIEQTFSPIKVLLMSLRYSFDFINNTISGYILLFVFSFLNFVCLSILYPINNYLQLTFQRKIVISFLVIAAVYLIIAASMAPTIFTFSAYPNQRSLFVPTFFLVIGVSLVSILFGSSIKINRKPFKLAVSILLIIVSFYTLRGSIKEFDTLNELKPRQTLWFERDQQVRSEVAAGKQLIQIKGIDSIETISDFNPVCLRLYYGIDEFILGE